MPTQAEWDIRHLRLLANEIATWSKDPSTQVGSVIVSPDRHPISWGYNGFPGGVNDSPDRLNDRQTKYKLTLHAERNAMIFAGRPLAGATLYVWPLSPCSQCAIEIAQRKIARVVSVTVSGALAERFAEDHRLAREVFEEAGVELVLYDPKDLDN